jgi:hypothetical protein
MDHLILALMPQAKGNEVAGPRVELRVVPTLDAAAHVRQVEHARVEGMRLLQPPHEVELQPKPAHHSSHAPIQCLAFFANVCWQATQTMRSKSVAKCLKYAQCAAAETLAESPKDIP